MTKYILGALTLLLVALGVAAGLVLSLGEVSPGPGQVVAAPEPSITVRYSGFAVAGQVLVDGRRVPLAGRPSKGRLEALPGPLPEGSHTAAVVLRTLLGRNVSKTWQFEVDRRGPLLEVLKPAEEETFSGSKTLIIKGTSDANAQVKVGEQSLRTDGDGKFEITVELEEGENSFEIVAIDHAGNEVKAKRLVVLDDKPPELKLTAPLDRITSNPPVLKGSVYDDTGLAEVSLVVDTRKTQLVKVNDKGDFAMTLDSYPEGERTFELRALDKAGNEVEKKWRVVVDTTERFGEKVTTLGAVGEDVVELEKRLSALGYLDASEIDGRFDQATLDGLLVCQKENGLNADGIAGPNVVAVLGPRIFVNLQTFELILEDPGDDSRKYSIAHGLPEHATPPGSYYIAEMVADPTWIPPDSAWAKEAEVTPPGADNPLGTRWLGFNTGLIGIHGTPYSGTIGTQASHGCIRMRTKEVEELYELVGVGTEVTIFAGTEDHPDRQRLWP